jgi:hypothetical protein
VGAKLLCRRIFKQHNELAVDGDESTEDRYEVFFLVMDLRTGGLLGISRKTADWSAAGWQ